MVSRNVSPVAIAQTPTRNATNARLGDTRPTCDQFADMGGRDEPESAQRHNQQTGNDAEFVPQLVASHPAGTDIKKYPR